MHDMSLLKNYFAKCDDLEKWIKNINTLKKAKDVTDIFEDENTREDRWHRLLGQPLNKIGVYTIPLERIVAIEKLFYKLVDDAKQLFSKSGKVDLYDHFSKIRYLLRNLR